MWTARVFTLYPEVFPGPLSKGLYGKALAKKIWNIKDLIKDDVTKIFILLGIIISLKAFYLLYFLDFITSFLMLLIHNILSLLDFENQSSVFFLNNSFELLCKYR